MRNIITGKDIPGSSNGKPIHLSSEEFVWKNASAFLSIGLILPD